MWKSCARSIKDGCETRSLTCDRDRLSSEELIEGIERHRTFCFDRSGAFMWMRSLAASEDVEKVYDDDSEYVKGIQGRCQ